MPNLPFDRTVKIFWPKYSSIVGTFRTTRSQLQEIRQVTLGKVHNAFLQKSCLQIAPVTSSNQHFVSYSIYDSIQY